MTAMACVGFLTAVLGMLVLTVSQPAEVHVAFFFAGFPLTIVPDDEFLPDPRGLQMLAAVRMAAEDINAGKYLKLTSDSILPRTKLLMSVDNSPPTYTSTVLAVVQEVDNAFNGTGINVVIGDVDNIVTQSLASIFQEFDIAQIGYNQGSAISHNDRYYDYLRIFPTVSYEGKVIADMVVNTFGWSRLAVFYTSDDIDSSDTFFEFNERANENNFTILGSMNFNKATTDFSSSILSALQSDPRVIVLFMKPERAAPFLEQAFTLGLLREGVTVVGGTYTSNSTLFSFFSPTAPVKYIMKGYIGLTPAINWTSTDVGQEFIRRWQQRNNTNGYLDANGTLVCDPATDDDGEYDMYRQHINYNDSKPYICAGLNFSTFNASNIYLEAAYAYDAMYAAAYALHDILYRQNLPNITGTLLKQALINLDPFAGITGTIQFSNGRTSRGNYGRGDRIHGYLYSIINFNPGSYVDAESAAFDTIGTCSSDGVVSFTLPAIYNSVDGKIPSDDPVGLNVELDAHSVMIYSTCAYVLLALTLFSATFCYVYRASSFIRIAQPTLLAWTLVGVLITLIRQFIIMTTVSYSQCVARIYLFHLSFYAIVGSLTAKMYRLHLMCNVSNHRQTDVSERRAHLYFIIGLGILFFYLVLQTTINPQNVVYDLHPAGDGQFTTSAGCAFSGGLVVMDYILLTAEGFALLYAAYLCVVTRNAPEIVNEFSITSKVLIMVLLYLVLFVLKYNIFSIDYILLKSFLSASCTALAAVVLLFTMPPKFRAFVGTCFHASVDISDGLKPFLDDIGKPGDRERMERGTKAEKLAVCFEHIRLWHFLLNRAVNFSDGSSQDESKQLIAEQATD